MAAEPHGGVMNSTGGHGAGCTQVTVWIGVCRRQGLHCPVQQSPGMCGHTWLVSS